MKKIRFRAHMTHAVAKKINSSRAYLIYYIGVAVGLKKALYEKKLHENLVSMNFSTNFAPLKSYRVTINIKNV